MTRPHTASMPTGDEDLEGFTDGSHTLVTGWVCGAISTALVSAGLEASVRPMTRPDDSPEGFEYVPALVLSWGDRDYVIDVWAVDDGR